MKQYYRDIDYSWMLLLVAVLLVLVASLIHDLHLVQLEIQKDTLIPKTKVKKELGILDELGM